MFKEGNQVRGADDVDGAADAIVVVGGDGERHKAAVAASGDQNFAAVEVGLVLDPIKQRIDVLVRTFAQHTVVGGEEGLAVAGRAAHVGEHQRDAHFVQE